MWEVKFFLQEDGHVSRDLHIRHFFWLITAESEYYTISFRALCPIFGT